MKRLLISAALLSSFSVAVADDTRIKQLEEQVKALQQQIEDLKRKRKSKRRLLKL